LAELASKIKYGFINSKTQPRIFKDNNII